MNAKVEEAQSLSMEFDLPHAPAKVWRALTDPALLAKWLMTTDMQPVVGRNFTFKMQPAPPGGWDGVVNCQVQEIDLHKRLRYSWRALGIDTVVTWTLSPTPTGGTQLRLEQSGFKLSETQAFAGAKGGWQWMAGKRLGDVLAEVP
ncbi:MAG: SRPBCC family protein [Polyangiaceae bacterium]